MKDSRIYADLDTGARDVADEVVRWRHHVHQHPELSNREAKTAAYITDHLTSLGLDEVRTDIAGHGVIGILRGGKPGDRVIALRGDIDALPVEDLSGMSFASEVVDEEYPGGPFPVAHACGHDCHVAMLMGAATVLAGVREQLPGTVMFVFQPAEEGPPVTEKGGAREMLAQNAFSDPTPTMVFGMHVGPLPKGVVGYRVGNQYGASCLVKITLTGKQVHGSTPWMGIDPMPAAGAILTGIGQIYRQLDASHPITVTIGHIEDVGRFNIVGETVTLWGTIRCAIEADMPVVQQRLSAIAEGSATAAGCTVETRFLQEVPAVHHTQEWVDAGLPTLQRVAGEDRVIQTPATLGYDDVSEFVNKFGGLYVMLGVQDTEIAGDSVAPTPGGRGVVANHSPQFYADDDTLVTGVRLHAHVAYDHLTGALNSAHS